MSIGMAGHWEDGGHVTGYKGGGCRGYGGM